MNTVMTNSPTDTRTFNLARQCLENWLKQYPEAYRSLFEDGVVEHSELPGDISPLRELGLIDLSDTMLLASKCIYPFDGMFILCDRPLNRNLDRVFPIFRDESILLAKWMTVRPGDVVLDLGTGSGVVALAAAKQGAKRVFASDVNNNAKEYFGITVQLNNLANQIEYVTSDVFDQLGSERFDVIASNPPFVPIPQSMEYYIHSDGGIFGTTIIERILKDSNTYLSSSGRLYMLALSLGGDSGWRVNSLMPTRKEALNCDFEYYSEPIYSEVSENLRDFVRFFGTAVDHSKWVSDLEAYGYDRLGYFAIGSDASAESAKIIFQKLRNEQTSSGLLFWQDYIGTMKNRFRRYSVSSKTTGLQ